MCLPRYAFFVQSPASQRQNHMLDHLPKSLWIDYPGWRHLADASCQIAGVLFLVTCGSSVPTSHSSAISESSGRRFAKVAGRAATCAMHTHFAEHRKCYSKSCANHVHAADRLTLRLAGMAEFSTIGYHSGRLGKFVEIWSFHKFAQPSLFFQVFRHALTGPTGLTCQTCQTCKTYLTFSIFQSRRGRMGPWRGSDHCVPGAPEISTLKARACSSWK